MCLLYLFVKGIFWCLLVWITHIAWRNLWWEGYSQSLGFYFMCCEFIDMSPKWLLYINIYFFWYSIVLFRVRSFFLAWWVLIFSSRAGTGGACGRLLASRGQNMRPQRDMACHSSKTLDWIALTQTPSRSSHFFLYLCFIIIGRKSSILFKISKLIILPDFYEIYG